MDETHEFKLDDQVASASDPSIKGVVCAIAKPSGFLHVSWSSLGGATGWHPPLELKATTITPDEMERYRRAETSRGSYGSKWLIMVVMLAALFAFAIAH